MLNKQKKNKKRYSNSKLHFIIFQTSRKPINLSISKRLVYCSVSILFVAVLLISIFSYRTYISNGSLNNNLSTLEKELQQLQVDNLKLGVENTNLKSSLDEKNVKVADALNELENLQSSIKKIKGIVGLPVEEDSETEVAENLTDTDEKSPATPPSSRSMMTLRNFDIQAAKQSSDIIDEDFRNIEGLIGETKKELEELLVSAEDRKQYLEDVPVLFPTSGKISSEFGARWGSIHKGVDISNSLGTKIYAAGNGVVTESKLGYSYGNYVLVKHKNGFVTRYAHMSKRLVNAGDEIKQGDLIGLMGNTGTSYGTHLHYEVYYYDKLIDPLTVEDYLKYK